MSYIESDSDTYLGFHAINKHARQRMNVILFRWPESWQSIPPTQRFGRFEDVENPARLFCLKSSGHVFNPARRRDYLCVSLSEDDLGDRCTLECFDTGMRVYRKSAVIETTGPRQDDDPVPPVECPFLIERIEQWFAAEDRA